MTVHSKLTPEKENSKLDRGITIPEFENYSITTSGDVYSRYVERYLIPHIDGRGYLAINIVKNNKSYTRLIHRLHEIDDFTFDNFMIENYTSWPPIAAELAI